MKTISLTFIFGVLACTTMLLAEDPAYTVENLPAILQELQKKHISE